MKPKFYVLKSAHVYVLKYFIFCCKLFSHKCLITTTELNPVAFNKTTSLSSEMIAGKYLRQLNY